MSATLGEGNSLDLVGDGDGDGLQIAIGAEESPELAGTSGRLAVDAISTELLDKWPRARMSSGARSAK